MPSDLIFSLYDVEINFGTYTNNWNGYKESVTLNSILEDTSNNHFYPG